MQRPSVLLRRNPQLNKRDFGHVLVVAGTPSMLGACALCSLAAMRSGAGMVTAAVAKNLNLTLQKKIAHVVMTLSLPQTSTGAISFPAFNVLKKNFSKFNVVAIGPGMGLHKSTIKFVHHMIEHYPGPMVIDADALNALSKKPGLLRKAKGPRILTPHAGEMARLTGRSGKEIESHPQGIARAFAQQYQCTVLLKGHRSVITDGHRLSVNRTGNVGMATAGSGDVLTGMIAAFLAQGIEPFEAARLGAFYHGKAGDRAVSKKSKISLIAADLIEAIPSVL